MKLIPADRTESPPSATAMRSLRSVRAVVVLDGDGHAHAWEPNVTDSVDIDITDAVAMLINLGLDAPPAPPPHWTSTDATTMLVSLHVGAHGTVTIDGSASSEDAATELLAAGLVDLLTNGEFKRRTGPGNEGEPQAPAAGADSPEGATTND